VYVAVKGHCKGAVPVGAPMGVENYVIEYDQIDDEMRKLSPEGYGEVKCAEGPYGKKIHLPTGRAYVSKGTVKYRGESNIAKKETALQNLLDAYLVNQNVTGIKWEDVTAVQRVERSWGTRHLLQIVFGSPRTNGSQVDSFYEPNSEDDGQKWSEQKQLDVVIAGSPYASEEQILDIVNRTTRPEDDVEKVVELYLLTVEEKYKPQFGKTMAKAQSAYATVVAVLMKKAEDSESGVEDWEAKSDRKEESTMTAISSGEDEEKDTDPRVAV